MTDSWVQRETEKEREGWKSIARSLEKGSGKFMQEIRGIRWGLNAGWIFAAAVGVWVRKIYKAVILPLVGVSVPSLT